MPENGRVGAWTRPAGVPSSGGGANHRANNAACAAVRRPSNTIWPSTTTVGIALTPYCLASTQHSVPVHRRSMTSQPHAATDSLISLSVSWQSGQPALNTSICLLVCICFFHLLSLLSAMLRLGVESRVKGFLRFSPACRGGGRGKSLNHRLTLYPTPRRRIESHSSPPSENQPTPAGL